MNRDTRDKRATSATYADQGAQDRGRMHGIQRRNEENMHEIWNDLGGHGSWALPAEWRTGEPSFVRQVQMTNDPVSLAKGFALGVALTLVFLLILAAIIP